VPLSGQGTVYPAIRIVDVWGILEVKDKGALMSADFSTITIPAPPEASGRKLQGDGWTLSLNPGWAMTPAPRPGSYTVEQRDDK